MAAQRRTAPYKGILKHTSSLDKHDPPTSQMSHQTEEQKKQMKWDEMNILATNHPADKDYGHMKIDEPPTPYSKYSDPEDEDMEEPRRGSIGKADTQLDPNSLALKLASTNKPKFEEREESSEESSDEEEYMDEKTKAEHASFELKRKLHYNEFQAVQLAKRLMAEEEDDDEDDDDDGSKSEGYSQSSSVDNPVQIDTDSNTLDDEHGINN